MGAGLDIPPARAVVGARVVTGRQWAAVVPAVALAAAGSFAGAWLLADWLLGLVLTVHYRRSRPSGEWVWR